MQIDPNTRAEIQVSDAPSRVLARRYGTTEQTVWKWRKRDSVNDRSHMAHRLPPRSIHEFSQCYLSDKLRLEVLDLVT